MAGALKKMVLFFGRQVAGIREGGLSILFIKVKKLISLSFLYIFAPVAVRFKLNWPRAYLFVGMNLVKRYKKAHRAPLQDLVLMTALENKIIKYYEKYVSYEPGLESFLTWIEANMVLEGIWFLKCDIDQCNEVSRRIARVQCKLIKAHQLDSLGVMFIPRTFAFGALGVYENLCGFIKAEKLKGHSRKMILLLDSKTAVNNCCYLNYWKRYITIITDPVLINFLVPLEKCLTIPLNIVMPFREKIFRTPCLALGLIREDWEKENRPPILELSDEDRERGRKCLDSLGVPKDAWFVCLHVREQGWRDNGSVSEDYRNADIATYFPAIEAITAAGGWVIRIGNAGMKDLPKLARVIDYAHSDVKSDWMDVFLCASCRFFIGTSSGPCMISIAFGVPVVMTNLLPAYAMYGLTRNDLVIPRLCRKKDSSRYLSFEELISPPVGIAGSLAAYKMLDCEIMPNEPDEIKELVIEMMEKCDGVVKCSEEDEQLQRQFRLLTEKCSSLYGGENIAVSSRIGRYFLRKYAALLPFNLEKPVEIIAGVKG